ncbi:MAG: protein phosphatase 2C domain-containing protein [Panacagrimonas sp.]
MPGLPHAAASRSPLLAERLNAYAAAVLENGGHGLRSEELQRLLRRPEMTTAVGSLEALMLRLAQASGEIEPVVQLGQPADFDAVIASEMAPVDIPPVSDAVPSEISVPIKQESPDLVAHPGGCAPLIHATTAAERGKVDKRSASSTPVESAEPAAPPLPVIAPPVAEVVATMPRQKMNLRLPNAKSGQPYQHRIDTVNVAALKGAAIAEVYGLEDTGLQFDAATSRLRGTPPPGLKETQTLHFPVRLDSGEQELPYAAVLELIVTPDPRALWNKLEPDQELPFRKPHQRCQELPVAGLRVVAASVRGRSHAHSGSFREDDYFLGQDRSGGWTIVAVSDGAGSAKLSRRGSQLACEESSRSLHESIAQLDAELEKLLPEAAAEKAEEPATWKRLRGAFCVPLGTAAFAASTAIKAQAQALGCDEKDFSATLLLAAVRPHGPGFFVATFWIGDGAVAVFDPERPSAELLGDADGGEYSGQTRFLLSAEFGSKDEFWNRIGRRVRCAWAPKGSILALMSDGVSDPKFGTDNALKSAERWQAWWRELTGEVNVAGDNAALPEDLTRYLDFWSQGEHDDRTLALVYLP